MDAFYQTCDPNTKRHIDSIYSQLSRNYDLKTPAGFEKFLLEEQGQALGEQEFTAKHPNDFDNFVTWLHSSQANAVAPSKYTDPDQWSYPLNNYFISSSHNTYLTGHQLYGKSGTAGYKNVLLRGCRCVEIDVWNGEEDSTSSSSSSSSDEEPIAANDGAGSSLERPTPWRAQQAVEPVVLHGYTATKMVPFRKVCQCIRDNAFVASRLPVIVSLEIHTNHEQQQMMVEIMQHCFAGMLLDPASLEADSAKSAAEHVLPSPISLEGKILIKVKYSPPTKGNGEEDPVQARPEKSAGSPPATELSDDETTKLRQTPSKSAKPSKIIEALSQMGVYTRSCHFKSFQQPEAQIPTHVFSLSEGGLAEVHRDDPEGLFKHNKSFFMRAYPKGTRISSSNLDPAVFWRLGVQMVALNWQKCDAGMMLNEAMFAASSGWVLKPPELRSGSTVNRASEVRRGAAGSSLNVEFFCGQDITPPKDIEADKFKPFVKVELHIQSPSAFEVKVNPQAAHAKDGEYKQHTKSAKGIMPDFGGQQVHFENLPGFTPDLSFIRFKVMHDDRFGKDDLASWACSRLDRLGQGYRVLSLLDARGHQSKGFLLLRIKYSWQKSLESSLATDSTALPVRTKHGLGQSLGKVKNKLQAEIDRRVK